MKRNFRLALPGLGLLLALLWTGWGLDSELAAKSAERQIQFVSLEDSLEPFKQYFNQKKDNPRVLALLSPT